MNSREFSCGYKISVFIINFPDFQSTMRRIMPRVEIVKRAGTAARHHKHLQFYEDE